jgi:hypothetical protein
VLSPLVSMECEKRAVRDFHGPVNPDAKGEAFLRLPIDKPRPNIVEGGPNISEFNPHQKIQIPAPNPWSTTETTP